MKTCNRCTLEKEETEFYKYKDGTYPYCKVCAKKSYAEKHYQNNKELYKKRTKKRNQDLTKNWFEFKAQFSCQKCGESRHWCLEFHHVDRSSKEGLVHYFFMNKSKEEFEEEFKKCVPLCRNCHADHHYQERNTGL